MASEQTTDAVALLLVDDEPALRTSLSRALELDRYSVTAVASGAEAIESLSNSRFDAMILDVSMPGGIDGIEVCRRLRAADDPIPILMLTARDAVDDRVAGLDAGADDYLVKPFSLRELSARLQALLRRAYSEDDSVLEYSSLRMDRESRVVTLAERTIDLSLTEYTLLELLMRNPDQVMTRAEIFESVWGYDFGPTSNALGVYIGYLRRKLEADGESRLIHTMRGAGYVLREEA